ncbi:MAG: carboxylating nicotinate-nucleotide diphosphorylase [Desulfobulbaceae bacterium]|uniref:Probable nicotinate-nucleotide pyrophosphorylase [carboxylating] n=1 Tax=Candidatus Desulfatifera sulfidica TaxID=2841691 RepID=A0A8J6TD62_9BACT|nr:carboxylating nicotinate-nucleotide diphosphorylase [Candidatus Desulfatifera sulfidica]
MDRLSLRQTLSAFLAEDIGHGDLTSESIFTPHDLGRAQIVARESCVVAGVDSVAPEVFRLQNPVVELNVKVQDGQRVEPGQVLLEVAGPVIDLLKAERVALNLLQRLSGISTLTAAFVERVKLYPVRITDTRKTTPGLRALEKEAVRAGGAYNHRFHLADGVLVKDNHIAACGSIARAVARIRKHIPHTLRIEVETDTLEQVIECLECKVDIIMLDNMSVKEMREAVAVIDGRALVEASGGVNLKTVTDIAATGVDIISIGALTHSASACDLGMDWLV